jgi:hypothetical protein
VQWDPASSEADDPSARGRAFLDVPFPDRDRAKKLGARWDADAHCWYVPAGSDIRPFALWLATLPSPDDPFVEVLGLPLACWKCEAQTVAVIACQDGDQLLFAHEEMLHVLASQLQAEHLAAFGAGRLRPRFSEATRQSSWSNECSACGAVLGSFPLRQSFIAFTTEGQESLPVIGRAQVPVELLR